MNKLDKETMDQKCGRRHSTTEIGQNSETTAKGKFFGFDYEFETTDYTGMKYAVNYHTTQEVQNSEESTASFTLADPDFGDYFVVSVWSDPDYGTPLLSLDGGASQCEWEVGTVHRNMPTLTTEYIGADEIGPKDAALFKVTIGNSLAYYSTGIAGGRFRPGWSIDDGGYIAPSFTLSVEPTSLTDALGVEGPVGSYGTFGKGTFDILLEVVRGSASTRFEFPAPQLSFEQDCTIHDTSVMASSGEKSGGAALAMPNPEQDVRFVAPCPNIAWSGKLLENNYFASLSATNPGKVSAAVVVPAPTGREITRLALEYRAVLKSGFSSTWRGFTTNDQIDMATADGELYSAAWDTTGMEDGIYEVRAAAHCTKLAPMHDYDSSTTTPVRGLFDRTRPELLKFTTSSSSSTVAPGDYLILTFSEEIQCNGFLTDGKNKADLAVSVAFGTKTYAVSGPPDYSCEGVEMRVSLPNYDAAAAQAAAGQEVSVTVSGVYDLAGNEALEVAGRVLSAGQASVERVAISAAVDARAAEVSSWVSSQVGAVGAAGNVTQDLVVALDAKVESLSANMTQHDDHVDTKIASLEAMLAQVLSMLGSEPAAARCGGDAAPVMNSFSRYIRGYLTGKQLAATPTFEGCAEKCLASAAGCAGFAFESSTSPCVIATGTATFAEAYSADVGGRWRVFAVKTACGK